jgi:hypothetical protein
MTPRRRFARHFHNETESTSEGFPSPHEVLDTSVSAGRDEGYWMDSQSEWQIRSKSGEVWGSKSELPWHPESNYLYQSGVTLNVSSETFQ